MSAALLAMTPEPLARPLPTPEPEAMCPLNAAFADSQALRTTVDLGDDLFLAGAAADYAYRVEAGVLMSYRLLRDGRRQVVDFHLPGEFLGLDAGVDYTTAVQAVTPAVVAGMRRRRLSALAATDVRLTGALWAASVRVCQRSQDHAAILARQSATERVAAFLLAYARRVRSLDDMILPMSRQDMADFLGLAIHTVSRTLTQMEGSGLISARSSRHVRLVRRDRLEALCS